MRKLVTMLLAGSAGLAIVSAAQAGASDRNPAQEANDAKLQQLEQDIQDLQGQVQDLKRSTADQYTDIQNQKASGLKVTLNNGRPTITGPDFTFSFRSLVQYDNRLLRPEHDSRRHRFLQWRQFRRARFGFEGTAFDNWFVSVHLRFRRLGHRSLDDQHGLYPVRRSGPGPHQGWCISAPRELRRYDVRRAI